MSGAFFVGVRFILTLVSIIVNRVSEKVSKKLVILFTLVFNRQKKTHTGWVRWSF